MYEIEHQWTLTGSLSPQPPLEKGIMISFPSPPSNGLVSSVGIGSAGGGCWLDGGGVISKNQNNSKAQEHFRKFP